MTLHDLIGSTLLECHFGKVWTRLVFSDFLNDAQRSVWVDTDKYISDQPTARYKVTESTGCELSRVVYPRLEERVSVVERIPQGVKVGFESGLFIFVSYEGDTVDSLLKLTDPKTGEWAVVN